MLLNEPSVPKIISSCSFLSMATPAMRIVPELLVQEFMATCFFDDITSPQARDLSPDAEKIGIKEAVVVRSFLGRQKTAGKNRNFYYAPAYPHLAEFTKIRKKDPKVIDGFLIGGAFAHYFGCLSEVDKKSRIEAFSKEIVSGLLGDTARDDVPSKELFAVPFENVPINSESSKPIKDEEVDAVNRLAQSIQDSSGKVQQLSKEKCSSLAQATTKDLKELLKLEKDVPRHHWIGLLGAFLRISMGSWLLSQANNIIQLSKWIDSAIKGDVPTQEQFLEFFESGSSSLLKPSFSPSDSVDAILSEWFKARIRVTTIINEFALKEWAGLSEDIIKESTFFVELYKGGGKEFSLYDFLQNIKNERQNILTFAESEVGFKGYAAFNSYISRKCAIWRGYTKTTKVGQAKNAEEFLRMLRKSEEFDDRASHIFEDKNLGRKKYWTVNPGSLAVQMFAFLAHQRITKDHNIKRGLILGDIEDHFRIYGIDYTSSPDGRKLLIERLSGAGLLMSNPDAGASIKINMPYPSSRGRSRKIN